MKIKSMFSNYNSNIHIFFALLASIVFHFGLLKNLNFPELKTELKIKKKIDIFLEKISYDNVPYESLGDINVVRDSSSDFVPLLPIPMPVEPIVENKAKDVASVPEKKEIKNQFKSYKENKLSQHVESSGITNDPKIIPIGIVPEVFKSIHINEKIRDVRYAQYFESWKAKVERIGALNFPSVTSGVLFNKVILSVFIKSDGTLLNVKIIKSSGNEDLDNAAKKIVILASPYSVFPPSMKQETDTLEITKVWSFENK